MNPSKPPPPPPRAQSKGSQPEVLRDHDRRVEIERFEVVLDLDALRRRIARGPLWKPSPGPRDDIGVPHFELYRCSSGRESLQTPESPRRCYCGNAHYHKVAGASLWICSTCHPPTRGARVVERRDLDDEGERS
jgi:hypothetical protein